MYVCASFLKGACKIRKKGMFLAILGKKSHEAHKLVKLSWYMIHHEHSTNIIQLADHLQLLLGILLAS